MQSDPDRPIVTIGPRAHRGGRDKIVATSVSAPKPSKVTENQHANARVIMTAAALEDTFPTSDPHDRAHEMKDGAGHLVPAAHDGVPCISATPRRYPRCYMLENQGSPPVSIETAFDETHERVCWLRRELGVDLYAGHDASRSIAFAASAARDDIRLRDILRPRTRQRSTWTGTNGTAWV